MRFEEKITAHHEFVKKKKIGGHRIGFYCSASESLTPAFLFDEGRYNLTFAGYSNGLEKAITSLN